MMARCFTREACGTGSLRRAWREGSGARNLLLCVKTRQMHKPSETPEQLLPLVSTWKSLPMGMFSLANRWFWKWVGMSRQVVQKARPALTGRRQSCLGARVAWGRGRSGLSGGPCIPAHTTWDLL